MLYTQVLVLLVLAYVSPPLNATETPPLLMVLFVYFYCLIVKAVTF